MPFLSENNWRAPRPPPTYIFSPKSPDQNFEIAILFSLVENLIIYSPHSPGEGLQVTNFDRCLHTVMVIIKFTNVFRGTFSCWDGGWSWEGVTWEDLFMGEFIMREENFHEGGAGFSSIIKKKNNEKINEKIFHLEVMSSIKT